MTELTLSDLGWSNFFNSQLELDELESTEPARITAVHRSAVATLSPSGTRDLVLPQGMSTGDVAVGDWVLAHPSEHRVLRRLARQTSLQRGTEYHTTDRQLIAANLDTLFITTSCNADFNVARLERYLALAHDADVTPVILLTKADQAEDPDSFVDQARTLGRELEVIALNAKADDVTETLAHWCGKGQTVALAGSSGVGKTTIANALTGGAAATQAIREDDARGRHTTTGRSLHRIPSGGWLIDTPGMRGLGVAEVSAGIDATFPEISELTDQCKFRDCAHESEPGCAVLAALEAGEITADRLHRYKKLKREDAHATETIAQARDRQKKFGKMVKSAMTKKKR
ncbi:ribosome biogenesis GTPase [Cognatiyoonia koreensis]|uniref:Small ribosomal subunit biogenesis GTPase RsgA n=1 Tax=Cognatiyoonia koreensis TaxID=364200 RepID=A0A1I0RBY4_9RHOB|nr:ribosome small subunit-dependent GTPase A [Cognatiyoonia koreensis]SEW38232.1 ribosome biogenesis GTPase [Cognatiyoonia koreensis]